MFKITLTRYRCITSCLHGLCLHDSKPNEKKRKHDDSNLPDGSGYGDHIQLLQIFECWDRNNYDPEWCKENGMQVIVPFCSSFLIYYGVFHVKSMVTSKALMLYFRRWSIICCSLQLILNTIYIAYKIPYLLKRDSDGR